MYKYPDTIELYMSKDSCALVEKEDICCEECYFPPRRYVLAEESCRPPKNEIDPINLNFEDSTDSVLERVAAITALVEKCNDMTKEVRKNLDTINAPKVSTMTQMVSGPGFPPGPRSIP